MDRCSRGAVARGGDGGLPSAAVTTATASAARLDDRLPVIVGAGQAMQRVDDLGEALDPARLMADAVRSAFTDAGLAVPAELPSLRVVASISARGFGDPGRAVASALGCTVRESAVTANGGNSAQSLVNATAAAVQAGDLDLAVLTGGECWRTFMRARAAGVTLWPKATEGVAPDRVIGSEVAMNHPGEQALGIVMPVQVYPMFETALRAAAGEGIEEHQVRVSELWARFAAVAADNPYAWIRTAPTAEEIRTVGPRNRMIGLPYPKLMNSNNDVDQAAALVVCSVARARAMGVPEDRWVFVHAGADAREHLWVSERDSFTDVPAVRAAGRAALGLAGIGIDDVALVDLYSCFPSAVQLGAAALGLSTDDPGRPLTLTGGLSFAGGPWNNYPMHAVATLVGRLRQQPDARGLVWANGGYVTKHAIGVYAAHPPAAGAFRHAHPQDEVDALPRRAFAEGAEAAGPATVEAWTVVHDRDGAPDRAFAALRLPDGRRAWATATGDTAVAMAEGEWVGRRVTRDAEGVLAV